MGYKIHYPDKVDPETTCIGINVPFIVRYPSAVKAGTFSKVHAHVIDILPTCLDYTGAKLLTTFRGNETQQELDGVSLKDVFDGSDKPVHDIIAWEHNGKRGLLKANWKIIVSIREICGFISDRIVEILG